MTKRVIASRTVDLNTQLWQFTHYAAPYDVQISDQVWLCVGCGDIDGQERAVITVQNGPFVAGAILTAEQINEAIDALQGARDALTMDMEDAS